MNYKRILTIQDISCFGQCSLTVALPILSATGAETVILPSAVLSTHTGGFTGFTFRDLSDDMPKITEHWQKEGIGFDAIYTGYLGSEKQISFIKDIFAKFGKGKLKVVDPAMADNGKLYYGFDQKYADSMATLCAEADTVLPNISEVCFMTGVEYKENYDESYIETLLQALESKGIHGSVILTGVSYNKDTTGVIVKNAGGVKYYAHKKFERGCHGTGDVFASAFCGALLQGISEYDSAVIAADYVLECIANTYGDESHKYGAKFETALPKLIKDIKEKSV